MALEDVFCVQVLLQRYIGFQRAREKSPTGWSCRAGRGRQQKGPARQPGVYTGRTLTLICQRSPVLKAQVTEENVSELLNLEKNI